MSNNNENYEKVVYDVLRPIPITRSFLIWVSLLVLGLTVCLGAYIYQLKVGLGVTGMRDFVSWGMYISNFVFFVATSLVGMLISAVLGLTGVKWGVPLSRIAEILALAFAAVAGLVIIVDMGRPDRLINVFIYGRFQSPILWDITVVTTYVAISALLLYLPLIPDLKLCSQRLDKAPAFQRNIYKILSLNWIDDPEQVKIITKSIRMLAILIVPVALAIHTVTSWLFAVTHRSGWDSSIFGPYFISGAFVSGCAVLIIAMYFFRTNYKLGDYITDYHFDKVAKLLVLVSLVYLYFNINEFIVPGYKLKKSDTIHLEELFTGHYAILFWATQIFGLILPIILLLFKQVRKAKPMLFIGIFVLAGSWIKRYLIVIPTMENPFLPIQHVPLNFKLYSPTAIEITITFGTILLTILIITVLSKFLPVIPIWETTHKKEIQEELG
jgi:molybdopterin-containing oxidoreductase family membrane subunit